MVRTFLILLLTALFGFFIPFEFLGQSGNIIFKIILYFFLGYLLFKDYINKGAIKPVGSETHLKQNITVPKPRFTPRRDIITEFDDSISTILNDEELSINTILLSQFEILYNFFMPNNGYIFIENPKNMFNLFFKKIKPGINWMESTDYPNIIKLLKNHPDEIIVENNLKEESQVLPFYFNDTYKPKSIFAYRIFLSEDQAVYFIFDSIEPGFFNSEDFNVPVQAGFTIQFAIDNAVKQKALFKELKDEKLISKINIKLNYSITKEELITNFVEFLAEIFEAHKLTVALVDPGNRQMASIVKSIGQIDSIKEGTRFVLDEGLCGKVILNNQVYLLDDIEKDGYFIPRFSKSEKTNYGLRSFLGIPLTANTKDVIGMICLEHKDTGVFTAYHKKVLKKYTVYFENSLKRFE
jgi:hypothetical protein